MERFYWTAINKNTGEIGESGKAYPSDSKALHSAKEWVVNHWKRGEALVEVWRNPYAYSKKTGEKPVSTERVNPSAQTHSGDVPLQATVKDGLYVIGHDYMGNLVIKHTIRPGEIFLQFESDRQIVYDLLKKWELKEVEKGYSVQVKDTEPRASILQELWEAQRPKSLPQTSRDPIIDKGRQYWNKVTATQKAILQRMGASRVIEVHSDGDLTFKAGDETYVLTTAGDLFVQARASGGNGNGVLPQTRIRNVGDDLSHYKVPPTAF